MDYGSPCDDWIKRLKFGGDWLQARELARLLGESRHATRLKRQADWILPMPVSEVRLRERGYNQAALLAQHWSPQDPRVQVAWLLKHRHTPAQAMADRAARWQQVEGSLSLNPNTPSSAIRGARVVVIDDVMTTGASLDVASRCLLAAGAARVDVVVFARTPAIAPTPLPDGEGEDA